MDMETVMYREIFSKTYGPSVREITNLIMAAEKAETKAGKKSFFGKDLGQEARQEFVTCLFDAAATLKARGQISCTDEKADVLRAMHKVMLQASIAFPNWQNAYILWRSFYDGAMQALHEQP